MKYFISFLITSILAVNILFSEQIIPSFTSAFGRVPKVTAKESDVLKRAAQADTDTLRVEMLSDAAEQKWAGSAVFFNLGNLKFKERAFDEAVKFYKLAIDGEPSFFMARKNLGFVYDTQGNTDAARMELSKALALSGSSDTEILLWFASKASAENDFSSALSYCNQALLFDKNNFRILSLKAWLLYETTKYWECNELCLRLLENNPSDSRILILCAKTRAAMGNLSAAVSPLMILRKSGKMTNGELEFFADVMFNLKMFKDALELYSISNSDRGKERTAFALISLGDYESALKIELKGNILHKIRAMAFMGKSDFMSAMSEIQKYLLKHSGDVSAKCVYASAAYNLKDFELSRQIYRAIADIPEYKQMALYGILHSSVALEDYTSAISCTKNILAEFPSDEISAYQKYLTSLKNELDKSSL